MTIPVHIVEDLPVPGGHPRQIPLVEYLLDGATRHDAQCAASEPRLLLTTSREDAIFWIIPYTWNSYVNSGLSNHVALYTQRHPAKLFIIWAAGDLEAIIPIPNALQFQNGINRSTRRKPKYAFELPAFWPDYLAIYSDGDIRLRSKQAKPSVGFCGQATSPAHKLAFFAIRNGAHHARYWAGISGTVPPPVVPSVLTRSRALSTLSKSPAVETNFVVRDQYRAGVRAKKERDDPFHSTKLDFVNNILDNDYTVCVRGGGNFSVRLYETLSLGRIPIFIDTDSRLPFDFVLDWKDCCVWVDARDIGRLPEILTYFHGGLSAQDFADLQHKCRNLWAEWLAKDSFLAHFGEHLIWVLKDTSNVKESTV